MINICYESLIKIHLTLCTPAATIVLNHDVRASPQRVYRHRRRYGDRHRHDAGPIAADDLSPEPDDLSELNRGHHPQTGDGLFYYANSVSGRTRGIQRGGGAAIQPARPDHAVPELRRGVRGGRQRQGHARYSPD